MRRIHDLLKEKYGKRMMMWGDIILQHPDKLDQIPKDTVMLTWGYGPGPSFEDQIVPFAKSGYEFFVCPGISNWSRILPDFGTATVNIRNFVRDGAKHGARHAQHRLGGRRRGPARLLGTATPGAPSAPGTPPPPRRRISTAASAPCCSARRATTSARRSSCWPKRTACRLQGNGGRWGITTDRFWENDFAPRDSEAAARAFADPLLAVVRPAIEHLEACRKDALVNADLLDDFLFGARRMELIGQRMLDGLEAARRMRKLSRRPIGTKSWPSWPWSSSWSAAIATPTRC